MFGKSSAGDGTNLSSGGTPENINGDDKSELARAWEHETGKVLEKK